MTAATAAVSRRKSARIKTDAAETPESPSARLHRLRRTAARGDAAEDVAFLTAVVTELGALVTRAVATLDQVSASLAGRGAADLEPALTDIARAIDLQAGHYGIWHRTAVRTPTDEPDACIPVLFCTRAAPYPKQGFYVTDETGAGRWEIYSALQDHALDYRGPTPEIWALAPDRPDPSLWDELDGPEDRPMTWTQDRAIAALRDDLVALGIAEPDKLIALPSLQRVWRETDQVRGAYLRTATALGVPATAHGPEQAARALREGSPR